MKSIIAIIVVSLLFTTGYSQSYYVVAQWALAKAIVPEHGFLPGKKLQFYPTTDTYDFAGIQMRIELYDQRDSLQLKGIPCATTEITNKSGFEGKDGALTVTRYFQTLCPSAGITIDSAASDTLKVYLEALDARLIGFGSITAHGLCKITMQLHRHHETYCVDITDKSPHSPIGKNAFVTRKTATNVILSAAVREAVEQFFIDLKAGKFQAS
jgi:hypothetical protein